MRASPAVPLLFCAATIVGCSAHDIGKECPQLLGDADPADPGEGRTETAEVIAYDVTFPCEEMICIATAGRAGYCSKHCREDAGCPDGFECREIQPVGEFAGRKYCAWKPCESRGDCGDDFCCVGVAGSDPVTDRKYCDFAEDGKCG